MSRSYTGYLAALVSLVALAHTVPLSAQQPPQLKPGQRVRVTTTAAGATSEVGTLVSVSRDTIVLAGLRHTKRLGLDWAVDTVRTAVPVAAVTGLEVSVGRGNRAGTGFLIGAVAGALIGGAALPAAASAIGGGTTATGLGEVAGGILLGGLVGGGVGALVGLTSERERWEPVPLEQLHQLRVGLMRGPGGRLRLGASVTF